MQLGQKFAKYAGAGAHPISNEALSRGRAASPRVSNRMETTVAQDLSTTILSSRNFELLLCDILRDMESTYTIDPYLPCEQMMISHYIQSVINEYYIQTQKGIYIYVMSQLQ